MAKINEIDITSLTFQEGSAPTTPASTKWKIYTKTDGLYYIDDAGSETGPLGTGGAAGTAPEWVSYLAARQTGETSHTDDDFFDDDALAGTAVTPTGTVTWSESYGLLSVKATATMTTGDTAGRCFTMTPSSAPVSLETHVKAITTTSANTAAVFVGFSDGTTASSNIAGHMMYYSSGWALTRASGTFTAWSLPDAVRPVFTPSSGLYWRSIWTATNTFKATFSTDGVNWVDLATDLTTTVTPTHYVLGYWNTVGANVSAVSFDYMRTGTSDLSL